MDYQETISYIHSTPKFARTLGNELLRKLLFNMGNPQQKLKFIHIAGTNGKGSCAVMLSEILQKSGYKTGLFISPYIESFNERIKVNGEDIPDYALAEITTRIKSIIEKHSSPVSEFALDAAIAFDYFNQCGCDIVVLETGLGGRLDATNVIEKSVLSVITSIGLDHTQYLGDTIEKIAAEKCGIIKNNGEVICYPNLLPEALQTVEKSCRVKHANLTVADMPTLLEGNDFSYKGITYTLGMSGDFQKYNAATVLCAAEKLRLLGWEIPQSALTEGFRDALNPGRLERLSCGLYLDGAHNVSAVKELCNSLKRLNKPISLCIAMMSDKDITGCVAELATLSPKVIATEIGMPRCTSAEDISDEFKKHGINPEIIKNPVSAAKKLISSCGDNEIPLACGSLYLVGLLRKELKG